MEVESVLVCIDVTEEVVDEALLLGSGLIICHHPLIFGGIKRLTGASYVERVVMKAIVNNVAIYAAHTNLDSVNHGVNAMICQKLGLRDCQVLRPAGEGLIKLVTFVPRAHISTVLAALFAAGAGKIGNYDSCSFRGEGVGTFRGNDLTNPFVGQPGTFHEEPEARVETVFPERLQHAVVRALMAAHPYEEVAYDLLKLHNPDPGIGAGMVGELEQAEDEFAFIERVKHTFGCSVVKVSTPLGKPIKRVALCGGSGSFLIKNAIGAQADVYITADVKYHDFFLAENQIVIADIGHYESEKFTKELFYDILRKKITNFAVHLTGINTNPINYL
jgi:dinuclear metal center YbgI/SA1388 family protein